MIRRLKRACGIHFSLKALCRNPGIHLLQSLRRHRSFASLLDRLAGRRPLDIVQVGANDGRDELGEMIRGRPERVRKALLLEPQKAAFDRLAASHRDRPHVLCLNAAIGPEAGQRTLHTISPEAGEILEVGDGLASFDRDHVEQEILANNKSGLPVDPRRLVASLPVAVATLEQAAGEAGIVRPDVLMVDTEGCDAEIVGTALDLGWRPAILRYEHKQLSRSDRRRLSSRLRAEGYRLWADHADVWGELASGADSG